MANFALPTVTNQSGTPAGTYVVRLTDMQPETHDQYGDQVKWVFTIKQVIDCDAVDPDEWLGKEIWRFTSVSMGTKAKMRAFAEGILGRALDEGEQLDADELIGKTAKATVVPYARQDGAKGTKLDVLTAYKPKAAKPARAEAEEGEPF